GGGERGRRAGGAPGERAGDGGAARPVRVEHLGQERPERDEGREHAVAPRDGLGVQGLLDLGVGQQVGERQGRGVGEAVAQAADLAGTRRRGSMSHGWPPWRWGRVSPSIYQARPSSLIPSTGRGWRLCPCHSGGTPIASSGPLSRLAGLFRSAVSPFASEGEPRKSVRRSSTYGNTERPCPGLHFLLRDRLTPRPACSKTHALV